MVQHVLTRGNDRKRIFHKRGDYWAFLRLMAEAQTHVNLPLLAYSAMPNHVHFVVRPNSDDEISAYMHWLLTTHVRRYHQHYGSTGTGHLYQGRFKNFLVQPGLHLINVLRYVEGNALRSNLVYRAEDWTWSSLNDDRSDWRPALCTSGAERPSGWCDYVNGDLPLGDLLALRRSLVRGAPYGEDEWVREMATAHRLTSTLRPLGRPKLQKGDSPPFPEVSDSGKGGLSPFFTAPARCWSWPRGDRHPGRSSSESR
jgi:putative transposase